MKFDFSEITGVLKQQISQYQTKLDVSKVGRVVEVSDGIARIYGLDNAMVGEILEFENDIFGEVFNLEEDSIGAVIYGEYTKIKEGSDVRPTAKVMSIPVGYELLGRVINPLCKPIDGGASIATVITRPIESEAPGIVQRQPVKQPLQTGLKSVDSMIPIGRGQRELIIGDRQIGKTALIVDTFINQKDSDVICIYVAIGQKASTVARVVKTLEDNGAKDHCIVVSSTADWPAPIQYIAPYAGVTMGEYFRDNGQHAVIAYDDLSKHAWAYRQVSLLLRRPPGREAYPGDVFYLHSRLLERAAKLNDKLGGGSLTALPIIETQAGDFSAYIPTNVISITDGQIYLEPGLFYGGIRPAINAGLSVSRVGGNAQIKAIRKVAGSLRLDLAQYRELEAFAKFGSELDKSTRQQLTRGQRLIELLRQDQYQPLSVEKQVAIIFLGVKGYLDQVPVNQVSRAEADFYRYMDSHHEDILRDIRDTKDLSETTSQMLTKACDEFMKLFLTE